MEFTDESSIDLLIERAHLAILRRDMETARTLLRQARDIDPANADAARLQRTLAESTPAHAVAGHAGSHATPGDVLEFDSDADPGELRAAVEAYEKGRDEAFNHPPLPAEYLPKPVPKTQLWLRLCCCQLAGFVLMFVPAPIRHPQGYFPMYRLFHGSILEAFAAAVVLGYAIFLTPAPHRQMPWDW